MTTYADILAAVALKYNTPPAQLMERTRKRHVVWMRDEAIARMYREVPYSTLEQVGVWFGLDHSSVRAAVRRHEVRVSALSGGSSQDRPQPAP